VKYNTAYLIRKRHCG